MSQARTVPRVRNGVPWWLWLVSGVLTLGVIAGILSRQFAEDPGELFDLAIAATDRGDGEAFAEILEKLREIDGADDEVTVLEGIAASATSRDPKAISLLEPYLDHSNERLKQVAIRYSAACSRRMGDAVRARDLYLKAAAMNPEDVRIHRQLAVLYEEVGAFRLVLREAEEILKLEPEETDAPVMKARMLAQLGQTEEAVALYESLLDTEGERASVNPDAVVRYLNCLLKLDRAEDALKFMEQNPALVSEPSSRISVFIESGKFGRAEEALEKLGIVDSSHPLMTRIRAQEAVQNEEWEVAVGLLTQAALSLPRNREIFELLKLAASKNDMPELERAASANVDAVRDLEEQFRDAIAAVDEDIQDADLRLGVARLAGELGYVTEARQWMTSAAQVDPSRQAEISARISEVYQIRGPLVPFGQMSPNPADPDTPNSTESASEDPGDAE